MCKKIYKRARKLRRERQAHKHPLNTDTMLHDDDKLKALINLAFCIVSMHTASNKVEKIQMKEGDDSSFEDRVCPPPDTSQEEKNTYMEKFKKIKFFFKFTGKNNNGIPDDKKEEWETANKELEEAIETPTYNGHFYEMLDRLVEGVPLNSMIGVGFEGDSFDCMWTKGLFKAVKYLSEKYEVHVFAVKSKPSKLLINKKFFDGWRDVVDPSSFETNWHFLLVGDDVDEDTKMWKEKWTNNVANVIVNFLSIRFHWNAKGDKFNAGARLMLEHAGLTATSDATMEKLYTDWVTDNTDNTDNMQKFIAHIADTNNIKLEASTDGLVNAVYRI